jgi:hypothetical protein
MVLVSGTFTLLARLVGAVAGTTLGWAVILLFGRVPQARQRLLSFMALGAVAWLVCVGGVLLPLVNQLVVSAVPRPGFVGPGWIGWLLLAGAVLLPAAVGAATLALSPEGPREGPLARLAHVVRGYPLTAVLAGTIVFLAAWGIVRSLRSMRRGWVSLHIPMMVKPDRYEAVVGDIAAAVARAGLDLRRRPASPWFVVPPRLLAMVGGGGVGALVPDRLTGFEADGLGILVYPSDVAIIGRADQVARARTAIARCLAYADAYLTAAKESEQIEDRLRELWRRPFVGRLDFEPVDAMLSSLSVPYDEWETLLRLRFQVEHDALAAGRSPTARSA